MRNINIKSLILGIGIGIVLTSIMGMLYYAGTSVEITREYIISEAKKYGMVENPDVIKSMNEWQDNKSVPANTPKP